MMILDLMDSLEERFDILKSEKGLSYQKIADLIGDISGDAIRKAVQRDSLKGKYIRIISDKLGINRSWLEEGTGQMDSTYSKVPYTSSVVEDPKDNAYIKTDHQYIIKVPLIHQFAYAGYLSGFGDPEYLEELPIIPFTVDTLPKGKYLAFEVKGDSMDNGLLESYPSRSQVLAREIQRHHWQDKLHIDKWDFVIVHQTEGILLKRIINHDTESGIITLHSLNDLYEDFEIHLNDCVQIFNVVKKILEPNR